MAQRTENEETEFKVVPETISLCSNCGALATTNNLCHKCVNTNTPAAAAGKATKSFLSTPSTRSSTETQLSTPDTCRDLKADALAPAESSPPIKRVINRCSGCRRKVGLTGFRCRCGELFCADHRYSDRHDCSYDYKSAGREVIARENPVVKAAKIVKI